MTLLAAPALFAASWWSWLDSRIIGEATLISVGAIGLGYLVSKIWPARLNPQLFGTLAAFLLVGGLTYAGSTGGALALALLVVLGLLFGLAAITFG